MELTEISDRDAWDLFVNSSPNGHPLQLWGWGESKRDNGWRPYRFMLGASENTTAGAQILLWKIPKLSRFIAYVPRGPVVAPGSSVEGELLAAIIAWAREHKVLYVRIEPPWTTGDPGKGWHRSRNHVQLPETYTINLTKPEDELLEVMSRKHRQYIRKSERDGVSVKLVPAGDLKDMYDIYTATAKRAGFGIHSREYYETLHRELGSHSYLYYAIYEGSPVAFLWLAAAGTTAYELYGGVTYAGGEIKANYFLKWNAIVAMKAAMLVHYDFNGRLNEGVSRFKDGFGPDETNYIGTWDYPISTIGYHAWEKSWPLTKIVGRMTASARSAKTQASN
jgi:lipid II:glycine glycyltransferase (peptidoglycan interpeptide bridge formation enzyme)